MNEQGAAAPQSVDEDTFLDWLESPLVQRATALAGSDDMADVLAALLDEMNTLEELCPGVPFRTMMSRSELKAASPLTRQKVRTMLTARGADLETINELVPVEPGRPGQQFLDLEIQPELATALLSGVGFAELARRFGGRAVRRHRHRLGLSEYLPIHAEAGRLVLDEGMTLTAAGETVEPPVSRQIMTDRLLRYLAEVAPLPITQEPAA